jgi:NAD(P)-dependent dehydrogenase (short-subunit alcohol dehydrogenase family)
MIPGILEGKTCLITGGSSGIGRATVLAFAAAGANVLAADIQNSSGPESPFFDVFFAMDVRRPEQIRAAVAKAVALHGRLDCAVNCAGIGGVRASTAEYPDEVWDQVLAVNLTGVFHCMKEELAVMLRQGSGAIVNVASVAGVSGFARHSAYSASKHGVVGITKVAALEYARKGIRVNAVCPGFTRTPMVDAMLQERPGLEERLEARMPVGRFGTPEEIASSILYLCSDAASFITGHAMLLDGGLTAG